jgi:SAM-dependent methyltransferase
MDMTEGPPQADFKARLRETYDAHAGERDRMGEAPWRWPLCDRLVDLMRAEGKTRLLEIGAGAGYTSRYFADQGLDVVAVDLSPNQVERCRSKGVTAYQRDFYELGFRPGAFDAVWAMNCLLHVPGDDLHRVLSGIRDVLGTGGIFCMGTWGGVGREGLYDDDFYSPPRFFALRTDEDLRAGVGRVFEVESFSIIVPDDHRDDELHVQFIRARKA